MDHPWSPPQSRPELLFRVHSKASRTHQRPRVGFAATDEKKMYLAENLAAFCQSIINHRTQAPKKSPYISLFEDFVEADMWAVALEDVTGVPASIYAIDVFHPSLQGAFIFKVSDVEQKCKTRLGNGAESEWMVCHRLATAAIIESITRTSTEVRLDCGLPGPSPPFYTHRDTPPIIHAPLGPNKITMQSKNLLPCGCIHEDFCRHFQWPGATQDWAPNRGQLSQRPPKLAYNGSFRTKPDGRVQQNANQSHRARKSNVPYYGPFPLSVKGFENLAKTRVQCSPQITTSNPNTAPKPAQNTTPSPDTTPMSKTSRELFASNEMFKGGQNGTPPRKEVLFPGHGRISPSQPVFLGTNLHLRTSPHKAQRSAASGPITSLKRKRPNECFSASDGSDIMNTASEVINTPLPGTLSSKSSGSSVPDEAYSQFGKPLGLNLHIPSSKIRQNLTENGSQASRVKSTGVRSAEPVPKLLPLSEAGSAQPSATLYSALSRDTMDARDALDVGQLVKSPSGLLGALDQLHQSHSIYATHDASYASTNRTANDCIDPQLRTAVSQNSVADSPAPANPAPRKVALISPSQIDLRLDKLLLSPSILSALVRSSLIAPEPITDPYPSSTELSPLNASSSALASSTQDPRVLTLPEPEVITPSKVLSPSRILASPIVEYKDTEIVDLATQQLQEDHSKRGIRPNPNFDMDESEKQVLPKLIHKMNDTETLEDLIGVLKNDV